ncbi:hypothetical protein H7F50_04635 [Novosphingobium flavum]|nr:hypothetical protein [Novosphingobium aerophilum]MBC2661030.1 hypothetical protein [Novosphingobium aerophilum]
MAVNIRPLAEAAMMTGSTKLLMLRMVCSPVAKRIEPASQYAKRRMLQRI